MSGAMPTEKQLAKKLRELRLQTRALQSKLAAYERSEEQAGALRLRVAAVCVILLTEAAVVSLHVTWASEWWRQPLWFTDRWHVLSFLSHWPAGLFIAHHFFPSPFRAWRYHRDVFWFVCKRAALWWGCTAIAAELIWWGVKMLAGKAWPMWWVMAWEWMT